MKKLSLLLLLLSSLVARENPFEPTQAYLEEQARMMEMEADYPSSEFQAKSEDELDLEDMTPRKMPVNEPAPTAVAKTEEQLKKEAQEKAKMLAAKEAKEKAKREKMLEEAMRKAKAAKAAADAKKKMEAEIEKRAQELAKENPVLYVKLRDDVKNPSKSMQILPFLNIEYTDETIELQTTHKVFKKLSLPKENKLIIDFYADVQFFTKRHELESEQFKKIAVGNHKKDKYFRVVLLTKMKPSSYKVDVTEELVRITLNEEMSN